MHRGYFKSWRQEIESAVWRQPPTYFKFWKWLQSVASTGNTGSTGLPAGSLSTTYKDIANALEWGPDKIRPSDSTIRTMLDWMVQEQMIEIIPLPKGSPRTTIITIINWQLYQANEDGQGDDLFGEPLRAPPKPKRTKGGGRSQYVPSQQAVRCLKSWEKYRPLPTTPDGEPLCSRDKYHKIFDQMHTLDRVPWDDLPNVPGVFSRCAWAVKEWTEDMIQSPTKMRTLSNKYPEKKEHEVMATQIRSRGKKPEAQRVAYQFPEQSWRDE